MAETLFIATCIANPLLWQTRGALARAAVTDWLKEPNVHVMLAECAYGSRGYELADLSSDRVTHIPLRAATMAWSKECLLNKAIEKMPSSANKIATLDADVTFRKAGWATSTLNALDLYPVVQPWDTAYDLGPHDEHIATHKSFASIFHAGKTILPGGKKWWTGQGGPYVYPHPGYAWAWQRDALNRLGGLFEVGGMGSGDHHMALGMVGHYEASLPMGIQKEALIGPGLAAHAPGLSAAYVNAVKIWSDRAVSHINYKLGFVYGTLEHPFHGRKGDRGYQGRWQSFLEFGFDPSTDLKRNTYGVIEFAGNKPDLERAFDRYLRSREEDVNTLT